MKTLSIVYVLLAFATFAGALNKAWVNSKTPQVHELQQSSELSKPSPGHI